MPALRRSICPISCTLDLIGDRWTLLVIRDLMAGKSHFKDFTASPEKIATNILTNRLTRLTEQGLVERYPSPESPTRDAYRLTDRGQTLRPVVNALVKWGLEHIEGTEARIKLRR